MVALTRYARVTIVLRAQWSLRAHIISVSWSSASRPRSARTPFHTGWRSCPVAVTER
jgi:hypothetical protein